MPRIQIEAEAHKNESVTTKWGNIRFDEHGIFVGELSQHAADALSKMPRWKVTNLDAGDVPPVERHVVRTVAMSADEILSHPDVLKLIEERDRAGKAHAEEAQQHDATRERLEEMEQDYAEMEAAVAMLRQRLAAFEEPTATAAALAKLAEERQDGDGNLVLKPGEEPRSGVISDLAQRVATEPVPQQDSASKPADKEKGGGKQKSGSGKK